MKKLGIEHLVIAGIIALVVAYLKPIIASAGDDEARRIFHQ